MQSIRKIYRTATDLLKRLYHAVNEREYATLLETKYDDREEYYDEKGFLRIIAYTNGDIKIYRPGITRQAREIVLESYKKDLEIGMETETRLMQQYQEDETDAVWLG